MNPDNPNLLSEFVATHSQDAFTLLVQQHIDLVYSAVLRQVNGDSGLAADVTQSVFIDLFKKAKSIAPERSLAAWLHRAARLASLAALRAEHRRQSREKEAAGRVEADTMEPEIDWNELSPVLDSALDQLAEKDRTVVLLRFFQKKNFRQISEEISLSEDAARMRLDRALTKLREALKGKGIKSSCAALGSILGAQSVGSAPAGLSISIAQATFALAAPSSITSILTTMIATKIKIGIATVIAAGAIALAVHEQHEKSKLQDQVAELTQRLEVKIPPQKTPQAEASLLAQNELARLRAEHLELMRLRGEVAGLRKDNAQLKIQTTKPASETKADEEPIDADKESAKNIALARMEYTKGWGMAFMLYANKNEGMMAPTLAEAAKFYPPEWASAMSAFDSNKFEIVYSGSLKDLDHPERTIILREKDPFSVPHSTNVVRTYLFADGHTEIHAAPDGNFEPWENERMKVAK